MNVTAPPSNTMCSDRVGQLSASFLAQHCFLLSANTTNEPEANSSAVMSTKILANGTVDVAEMKNFCGVAAMYKYGWLSGIYDDPYPVVVNVSKIAFVDEGGPTTMRLTISNCNGSETINTTETGVFVMRSPDFFIAFEREPKLRTPPYCPGTERVEYTVTPLQNYCQNHTGLAECGSQEKANASASSSTPPAASSKAPAVKHSMLLAAFSACLMLTLGLFGI